MAIRPSVRYGSQVVSGDPGYPDGKAKNETTDGARDGTPVEKDWLNDIWGFLQALLGRTGITPSGTPDAVGASQYLDALDKRFGTTGNLAVQTHEAYQGAIHPGVYDTSAQGLTDLASATMSADGSRMFVLNAGSLILQHDLSVPFDARSGAHNSVAYITPSDAHRMVWKPDGTRFYLLRDESGTPTITQYDCLTTPWHVDAPNVSAAGTKSLGSTLVPCRDFAWRSDGEFFYLLGENVSGDEVIRLWDAGSPSNAWDVTQFNDAAQELVNITDARGTTLEAWGIEASGDAQRLFVNISLAGGALQLLEFRYDGFNNPTVDALYDNRARDMEPLLGAAATLRGIHFTPDGGQLVFADSNSDKVASLYSSVVRLAG